MAYEMNDFKTIDDVIKYLGQFKKPYVALEGSRTITHEAAEKMEKIAKILVTALPNMINPHHLLTELYQVYEPARA